MGFISMNTRLYLFIFYLISHCAIFFIPNAIFWDDYMLHGQDNHTILEIFHQNGAIFKLAGYLHITFLSMGLPAYKLFTFISFFISGLIFDKIIQKYAFITPALRFFIVIIFMTLPFNFARVSLIVLPYTLNYLLFFVAWILIERQRILSLLLFFLSFNTNSLLVFFALPFFDYYYRSLDTNPNIQNFSKFCIRKIDFFVLPFIFFIIKNIYYQPSGLYEGYNENYSLINLFRSTSLMMIDWIALEAPLIPIILIAIPVYFLLKSANVSDGPISKKHTLILGLVGLVAVILGGFPYWILGHIPAFTDWSSRHQLLLPFGSSLLVVALVYQFLGKLRFLAIAVLISAFTCINIKAYWDFYYDWQKQIKLVELIGSNEDIRNSDLVIFQDNAFALNALNRKYRIYEWNGLLSKAFGDEARMGINLQDYDKLLKGEVSPGYFTEQKKYRAMDFDKNSILRTKFVEIKPDRHKLFYLFKASDLVRITVYDWNDTVLTEY